MSIVGAVDCGTNSIRLLVADVRDGRLSDLHRDMRVVRLGQGVDATGQLAPEAIERTRVELASYAATMAELGVSRVRMVATSATRDASNRDDFFAMTAELLGPLQPGAQAEVISGDEEARLSFIGAVGDLDPADGPFAVTDLGGGSTELVTGDESGVAEAFSANIGCVRLTERCLHSDPPTIDEIAEGRAFVRSKLDEAFAAVPVADVRTWVGVAGTMTTLSAIAQGLDDYDPEAIHLSRISLTDLDEVCERLLAMSRSERAALGPMHPGRVDVVGGGAIVSQELARMLADRSGVRELVVSEHDILDGIALGLG